MQGVSTDERKHFRTLQVLPSADIDIIEQAYWHLAYKHHNAARSDPSARARLQQLNEAMSAIGRLQSPGYGGASPATTGRPQSASGGPASALRDLLLDAWWFLMVVATLALGVALVDHWAGIRGLSEHLADWRRTIIIASSATLAGLVGLAFAASLVLIVGRVRSKQASRSARADKDYYTVLHLERFAEPDIAAIAYRHLVQKYNGLADSDPWAAQALREVDEAFAVIGDPERRATYDALIEAAAGPPSSRVAVWQAAGPGAREEEAEPAIMPPVPTPTEPLPAPSVGPVEGEGGDATEAAPPASGSGGLLGLSALAVVASRWKAWASMTGGSAGRSFVVLLSRLGRSIVFVGISLMRLLAFLAPVVAGLLAAAFGAAFRSARWVARESRLRIRMSSPGSASRLPEREADLASSHLLQRLSFRDRPQRGLEREGEAAPSPVPTTNSDKEAPMARLVVVAGTTAGRIFRLRPGTSVTIGSDPACDVVLSDDQGSIAPRQARIWPRQDKFMFHLLSADLPMTVQGKPFAWVVLEDGDLIEVGQYRLRFEIVGQAQG